MKYTRGMKARRELWARASESVKELGLVLAVLLGGAMVAVVMWFALVVLLV